MATALIDRAIEVLGGAGVRDDTPLAYFYSWARALRIADGPEAGPSPLHRPARNSRDNDHSLLTGGPAVSSPVGLETDVLQLIGGESPLWRLMAPTTSQRQLLLREEGGKEARGELATLGTHGTLAGGLSAVCCAYKAGRSGRAGQVWRSPMSIKGPLRRHGGCAWKAVDLIRGDLHGCPRCPVLVVRGLVRDDDVREVVVRRGEVSRRHSTSGIDADLGRHASSVLPLGGCGSGCARRRAWRCLSGRFAATCVSVVANLGLAVDEVFVPLCHEPGAEAEVDWGEATVLLARVLTRVFLFLMRACFSGALQLHRHLRIQFSRRNGLIMQHCIQRQQ